MAIAEVRRPDAATTNMQYVAYSSKQAEGSARVKPQMGVGLGTAQGAMQVRQEAPKPLEVKQQPLESDGIGVSTTYTARGAKEPGAPSSTLLGAV